MNLVFERAAALPALGRVAGLARGTQVIPILSNVVVAADEGGLTLRATDLDSEMIEAIPAVVGAAGVTTVAADKLHDIVRNADAGAQVGIQLAEGDPRAKVKYARSNFSLPTIPPVSFPTFGAEGLDAGFKMPGKLLADMISRVLWSIDPTDTSTVKGVVRLATYEGEIHAVGANSSGVALRREPAPEGAQIGVSLTPKTAGHIVRWLSDVADDVHVASSAGKIRITHGGSIYTSKLFDAVKYFPYEGKIVETHENLARVDQDALSTALRRVMIMSDSKIGTLRLTFAPGELTVSARNDASGDGVEVFVIDYEGPEAAVLIKGSQLAAIIAAMQGDIMEFGFSAKAGEGVDGLLVIHAPVDRGLITNVMQMKA